VKLQLVGDSWSERGGKKGSNAANFRTYDKGIRRRFCKNDLNKHIKIQLVIRENKTSELQT
jgi:hypothetical protein